MCAFLNQKMSQFPEVDEFIGDVLNDVTENQNRMLQFSESCLRHRRRRLQFSDYYLNNLVRHDYHRLSEDLKPEISFSNTVSKQNTGNVFGNSINPELTTVMPTRNPISANLSNFGLHYENTISMENFSYGDTKDFLSDELQIANLSRGEKQENCLPDNVENALVPYPNQQYINNLPPSVGMIPSNEEFPGVYNFDIILFNSSSKYNWVYSKPLNKVFINMGHPLPVIFRWIPAIPELFVRATPLFALPQHSQERVVRCLNHSSSTDISNKDVPEHVYHHVIRCSHPSTRYFCDVDGRFSIVTPLGQPQPGTETVRLMYTFMCKNSCTSGMNRRPLEIVYTLESSNGEIFGRRKHEARICSCPKRDKDKEEDEVKGVTTKKRKLPTPQVPYGKKLPPKEELDLTSYTLPALKVVGRDTAKAVLRFAHDLMAGNALRHNALDAHKPYLDEIEKKYRSFDQGRN